MRERVLLLRAHQLPHSNAAAGVADGIRQIRTFVSSYCAGVRARVPYMQVAQTYRWGGRSYRRGGRF
jgi:hypothetical protein